MPEAGRQQPDGGQTQRQGIENFKHHFQTTREYWSSQVATFFIIIF